MVASNKVTGKKVTEKSLFFVRKESQTKILKFVTIYKQLKEIKQIIF